MERIDVSELKDFPQLTAETIRKKITFGWYQISQGISYLAEHFDRNGDYEVRITNKNVLWNDKLNSSF